MTNPLPAYPQSGVASTCRSYDEYVSMFNLSELDLRVGPVLDVAGGAASFTAVLCSKGIEARATDPFYEGDRAQVIAAAEKEIEVSSAKVAAMASIYDWTYYGSPEQHRALREDSCGRFASHFESEEGHALYTAAYLPNLPYASASFANVFCSHFLFLYAAQFGEQFHEEALRELLRVTRPGGSVRIYPLVTLTWEKVAYLDALLERLTDEAEAVLLPSNLPFVPVASPVLQLIKRTL